MVFSALVLLGTRVGGAAEPSGDDPLPKGAKLRLGSDRLTYRYPPVGTLVPPDYKTFLISDVPLSFHRYDAATGKPLDGGKAGSSAGGLVVVSADGKRAVVLHTGILTVRDVATGRAIRELKPPAGFGTFASSGVAHVSLTADGKRAAQGVTGPKNTGTVLIWDVDAGTVLAQFEGLQTGTLPVLSADGTLLATRAASGPFNRPGAKRDDPGLAVQVWDVGEKKELFKGRATTNGYLILACAFSPDGSLLATSCGDGPIDVWDVKAQKLRATLLGRTGQGQRIAFSPDGKTLAAVASDGAVQRWATSDGKVLATTELPTELPALAVRDVAFVDNERVIAWGGLGPTVVAWESPSGKFLRPLSAHAGPIRSIGFANGGKQIVTTGLDGRVVQWDAATGTATGTTGLRPSRNPGYYQPQVSLSLAPDAARIFGYGAQAAVFDPATGTELFVLPRTAPGRVLIRAIPSADVTRAVTLSASSDGSADANWTATVWDLIDRKKVAEWDLPVAANTGPEAAAALSPSGDRLVVARFAKGANVPQSVMQVTGFDLKTGKKLGTVEDHSANGSLFVAAASETTAVVASGAGRLRLYNYEDGRGGDEIEADGRGERGTPVVFSPDGKRFAFGVPTGNADAFGVRVYDWPSGKTLHTFTGHRAPVTALTFSPDGKTLASGSADSTVLLWDVTEFAGPK